MAASLLSSLLLCVLVTLPSSAQKPQSSAEFPLPARIEIQTPEHPILRSAFQAQFSEEQLARFQGQPTLRQLVQDMSPEQRQGARTSLAALEQTAKTPADLEAIARGFLLLDEREAVPGQDAIRVAKKIQDAAPRNSTGYTLAANAYHQMGDYPSATQWAQKALELDSQDDAAIAVFMLSAGRVARGGLDRDESDAMQEGSPPAAEWTIPEEGASPRAQDAMRQAIAAREGGDFDKTMRYSQSAMRADPASRVVQEFYRLAADDHARHVDALTFLQQAGKALKAGNGPEALDWARKAAQRSTDPKTQEFLASFEQKVARMSRLAAPADTRSNEAPKKRGFPALSIAMALGVAAAGFGLALSKRAWSGQESEPSENEDSASGRIQRNRRHLNAAAISLSIGFATVLIVTKALPVVVPLVVTAWRAAGYSQRMSASGIATLQTQQNGSQALSRGRLVAQRAIPATESSVVRVESATQEAVALEDAVHKEIYALRTVGKTGSSPRIRLITGSLQDAEALFQRLSGVGRPLTGTGYPGTIVELPNGAHIGLRPVSVSGPPTVDIHRFPGIVQNLEIKFVQSKP
ncbi:MAG: tetratricopeptide repeat protein [Elusimicrobiota bacterium]|jgi:tetratricopeptide (TPR) repeat protein